MEARYKKQVLHFKSPSETSRGILTQKETWFLIIEHQNKTGIGECAILRGLSADDRPDYETKLQWICQNIQLGKEALQEALLEYPSLQFGIEQAFLSLYSTSPFLLFPSEFTNGRQSIPINGLIWMGSESFMKQQIQEKLQSGFRCIKIKIGTLNFDTEIALIASIRKEFSAEAIEIRVDANGAFTPAEALEKLKRLADLELHSIEQPIKPHQWEAMAELCAKTPLSIALDEELIGIFDVEKKKSLLHSIQPHYIVLKPSLIGGYGSCEEWIRWAEERQIGWWITSALESNVGLNAIAQYTFTKQNPVPQGLGTGSLYKNNIESPLEVSQGFLTYNPKKEWNFTFIKTNNDS
jgi:o-succinylbenzoate synthase